MVDPKSQEFIGVDVGSEWIGLARGNSLARLAEPLITIPASDILAKLPELIRSNQVDGIVIGLPRNLSGEDTHQTALVRQWVKGAKSIIKLPFYWQDEALTSKQAISHKLKAKNPNDEHAISAAIFLQDFLETAESDRVST